MRRAQVALLVNAQRYHEKEIAQKEQNQTTIFDWLTRYKKLRSGLLVGPNLKISVRIEDELVDNDNSESTQENEFEWDPLGS